MITVISNEKPNQPYMCNDIEISQYFTNKGQLFKCRKDFLSNFSIGNGFHIKHLKHVFSSFQCTGYFVILR